MQDLDISIKNSHRTAVAEAIFTFFYAEASRKCVLQEFVIVSFIYISYEQHITYIDLRFIRCNCFT